MVRAKAACHLVVLFSAACTGRAVEAARIEPAPTLTARVGECRELWYEPDEQADRDRPPFVRGASGLAYVGDRIAVVQDDTQFLGMVSQAGTVDAVVLPPGPENRRRFDDHVGNRHLKLDLEAVTSLEHAGRAILIAFGSGSTLARENILVLGDRGAGEAPEIRIVPAGRLYAQLRQTLELSGVATNIEGAATSRDELVLLHRGSTSPADHNAVIRFDRDAFLDWLERGGRLPKVTSVERYDLGAIAEGVPYTFSGLTAIDGNRFAFTASAEAGISPLVDGPVLGSKIGFFGSKRAWSAELRDAAGARLPIKAESVLAVPGTPDRFLVVLDGDDSEAAARLCDVQVLGL
jgi:hypothetical protein